MEIDITSCIDLLLNSSGDNFFDSSLSQVDNAVGNGCHDNHSSFKQPKQSMFSWIVMIVTTE